MSRSVTSRSHKLTISKNHLKQERTLAQLTVAKGMVSAYILTAAVLSTLDNGKTIDPMESSQSLSRAFKYSKAL